MSVREISISDHSTQAVAVCFPNIPLKKLQIWRISLALYSCGAQYYCMED